MEQESRNNKLDIWVSETHKNMVTLSYKVKGTLFSGQSPFQQVDIVETHGHGTMLLNDGVVMLCERDEFIYHEMIAHVPLLVHPDPKKVLIIGGGDGGTAREVLKHESLERVVMVEIDEMVVEACKEYFPAVSCSLDDPRLALMIDDGIKFVAETDETFDVVIVDSTDPMGPAVPLFGKEFYENTARILGPEGIMITQSESPFYDIDIQLSMMKNQRPFFQKLHLYTFTTVAYPGGLWTFGFASKSLCPVKDYDPSRYSRKLNTRYYNPGIHRSAFMLPNFMLENMVGLIDPID